MKSSVVAKFAVLILGALLSLSVNAISERKQAEIEERLQPFGMVCLEGDNSCGTAVAAVASGPQAPEDIYQASCSACHASGAAGAPVMGDAANWATRSEQGIDTLYTHAIGGFNGMPPKGLCMSCSDDEIKATVDYILANSK